ncbi:Pyruvate/2-oxoglutarate dehydrogenase complex, dihydrolipoamide dehydrogenase (E3) component [Methylobacterium sp. 174MFSha1.1]|uniref:mercuric reductase n=1 Tax=Methylobacterium sp. 174MFSha1.1 TaxID=1502749 RepID=UPI0008E19321|nr:mercuric reductase [Methylobacterium sp. 174MFSha1.1]SFV05526.1 Pyruvate/2-oxoglutarate dehydrogenase complex, dihydrolipoamide dehydrogenase (E3) component [Methylobacterium sp. 174MFSha1.1]
MSERYDAVVIGSGEGGKFLAWDLAKAGQRVAVVERSWIGGSCPNTNCLPSKNEIWSAEIAHLARNADRYGVETGPVRVDMRRVVERKRAMVAGLVEMHLDKYRDSGAELVMGSARFTGPKTVAVDLNAGGERVLTADTIVLNLGTRPAIPDVPGLREAEPLTNIEALELDVLPDHMIVLGGGYVGLELAQAYRRFGSTVTVIERSDRLAGREDADVADELARLLTAEGIALRTGTAVVRVRGRSGDAVEVVVRSSDGESVVAGSHILVAAGRTPNTDGIGLDRAGVAVTERGTIQVDDRLATTAPGIWAIGECAGSPAFTHASADDYRVVRDALKGGGRSTAGRQMPYCLFTDPPLARVGLSETEARAGGAEIRVAKLPMRAVLRTRTTGLTDGFMKAMIGPDDRILGFAMIGADAGEVMVAVQVAMLAGLPYTALRDAILAHPTTAEGLNALFAAVPAR